MRDSVIVGMGWGEEVGGLERVDGGPAGVLFDYVGLFSVCGSGGHFGGGLVIRIELDHLRREWGLEGFEVARRRAKAPRFLGVLNDVADVFVTALESYRICSLCNISLTGKMFVRRWQTKDKPSQLCVRGLYACYRSYYTPVAALAVLKSAASLTLQQRTSIRCINLHNTYLSSHLVCVAHAVFDHLAPTYAGH